MCVLLPLAAMGLLTWLFVLRGCSFRKAFLLAMAGSGLLLVALTELLSLRPLLTRDWLAGSWLVVDALLLGACLRLWRHRVPAPDRGRGEPLSWSSRGFVLGMVVIVLTVAGLALRSAPNSWDGMTYHMARVFHWADHHSVQHYPTHITRQLHLGPCAEFAILHFQILAGSDRFANMVAWGAMAGTVLVASYIAKLLGAKVRGQILAALAACTLPTSILAGSTPQSDCVLSFWLACFVALGLEMVLAGEQRRVEWLAAAGAGVCVGLALLTKGTGYLYAAPFCLGFGLRMLRRLHWRAIAPLLLIAVAALAMNLGHSARNMSLTGDPLGPPSERAPGQAYGYVNEIVSVPVVLSNMVRNLSLHLCTPSAKLCEHVTAVVRYLHRYIGIDPDDPRTTWTGERYRVLPAWKGDTNAPDFLQLLLLGIVLLTIFRTSWSDGPRLRGYSWMIILGSLLFWSYLRWQPWHARLHLPVFVLGAPLIGLVLERHWKSAWAGIVGMLLLVQSVPFLLHSINAPMFGSKSVWNMPRQEQYFRHQPALRQAYLAAVNVVKERHAGSVGLRLSGDDWDYPLCLMLRKANPSLRIRHVNVTNYSRRALLPEDDFVPDLVLTLDPRTGQLLTSTRRGAGIPSDGATPDRPSGF